MPEIIDPVFAKTSQNARFLLSENERFGLVFVKTGSINSGTGLEILLHLLEGSHDYLVGGDLGIREVMVLLHGLLQPLIKGSQPQALLAFTASKHLSFFVRTNCSLPILITLC